MADGILTRIKIRTARTDDAGSIAGILTESFAEFKSFYTTEAFAVMTPGRGEIEKRFDEPGKIWVAVLDGELVGTVSILHQKEVLYIRSLAIVPAAQGLRIGESLLLKTETYAVAQGFMILYLNTGEFLHRAVRLYERFGFSRRGTVDFYGTRLIAMKKYLE